MNVNSSALENCLRSGQHPKTFRYRDFLFCLFEEIEATSDEPLEIEAHDVSAILGDRILLTLSNHHSAAVERVRNEISTGEVHEDDISSSNYLFTRLLGSSLHRNHETITRLYEHGGQLLEKSSNRSPAHEEISRMRGLSTSVEKARYSISCLGPVLMALREERNLFGAPRPKDSLERYRGIASDISGTLELVDHHIEELRDEWRTRSENVRNDMLFKLTALTGATTVLSAIFGFFGQNFTHMPFSNDAI